MKYKTIFIYDSSIPGEFQAIEKYIYDSTAGLVKWEENWITFIDNMLQMKILEYDTRLLYVPTFLTKMTIAADSHCDLIKNKFKHEKPLLPVYSDRFSGEIRCGGITISGLIPSSISRQKNFGIPLLERYEFISNSASLDLQTSIRVNIQIVLENTLMYKVKAVELIDEYTDRNSEPLTPFIKLTVADEPLVQASLKILSSENLDVDIEIENESLECETDNLLVIGSRMLTREEVLKQAFGAIKPNGYIISREFPNFDVETILNHKISILTIHRTRTEVILLLQKQSERKDTRYIEITSSEDFSWLPNVQDCLTKNIEDLVLYSQKQTISGIQGLVKCLRREPDSSHVRCVFIMDESKEFDPNSSYVNNQLQKNMAFNVFKDGQWGTYRNLILDRLEMRERDHAFVKMTKIGDFSSFVWTQGPIKSITLNPYLSLVIVYYSSLNFRDVMVATGRINIDVVTSERLKQEFYPGFEYSGIDTEGKRVMGTLMDGALSNLVPSDPLLTYEVPDEWTLEEAATIPVVYTTVIYALIMMGQIKEGNTILIHSGTGGIGQAAIHIAQHFGCKVFVTVGTQAKRDFLMTTFPHLEEGHIGNSHDESFEQMVYQKTNGRGVDIVLNSLAEDKLIASVRCLAKRGRFLELGKYDLANNNFVNLMLLRKEAVFHGISLDKIFKKSLQLKREIKMVFEEAIKHGAIKPLNRTVFKFTEIEQAFRFMAAGKHTGKVLIQIQKPEKGVVDFPKAQKIPGVARYFCDPESAYIIVGGLGGIALELADWLIHRGARKILLTSRKGLSTGYQCSRIRVWTSNGVTVRISTASLKNETSCRKIIEEGLQLGPISSIFNLAVVLADSAFENQTKESFFTSFLPKALGTAYLDDLSRKMCPDLRDFVVFSSVSCGRGNMGQTNYGMANSVMERICEKRKQDGYPALAIEWGAVGEVGLVAEMQKENSDIKISGTLPQRIWSCLEVLDNLLAQKNFTIVSSIVVAEKVGSQSVVNAVDAVINIIGIKDSKYISLHSTLAELGMDSMTGVEIKQILETDFGIFLSAKDIRSMTLTRLKEIQESKNETAEKPIKMQTVSNQTKMHFEKTFLSRFLEDESGSKIPFIHLLPEVNNNSEVPKVLLFPGIEGFAKIFTTHINNAVALQYVVDGQTTTVHKSVESLLTTVENFLTKDQSFTIVAYSYGTLIALELVNILESQGYLGTVICIDGAPQYVQKLIDVVSESYLQTNLMYEILSYKMTLETVIENKETIANCKTWQEKMDYGLKLLQKYDIKEAFYLMRLIDTIYRRLKDLYTYTPAYRNLKSNIRLFKPAQATVKDIENDFGLSQFFEKPVEIQYFEGNHETILENLKVADAINSIKSYNT